MTMASGYDLQLLCDGERCEEGVYKPLQRNFFGETGPSCRRRARKAGWKLFPETGHCLCPACAKRGAAIVE